jgi:hypothetical protein
LPATDKYFLLFFTTFRFTLNTIIISAHQDMICRKFTWYFLMAYSKREVKKQWWQNTSFFQIYLPRRPPDECLPTWILIMLCRVSQSGIKLTELLQNVSQLLQTVTICAHTHGGFSNGPKH